MPFALNGETKIYWEEHGTGDPVLLIMGLGVTLEGWSRLWPALSAHYRVILLDNRGVGRSSDTNGPVSIAEMAGDAKAVLDAAGVGPAHVIGTSMGGMIAQEFVLNYPESVRSLILSVTMCGGKESVPAEMNVLLALQSSGTMSATEAFWAMAPFIYDVSTPRSVLEDDLNERLRHSLKPQNYLAQLQAIVTWQGTFARLGQIRVPTLVLHGMNDQLIVPQNGRNLAAAIPNAELVELENASHMFLADQPERSAATVLSFLESV